ncbi:hypothetical protein FEAC_26930 [Ferrimicrobium acidiphilum DSM 19497]|uniref:Uncharacterized protein n=1 Tax=Ferrimicrobium acidiphilum DSM 19497 TaxID=1121877 RepID=A0A0D8FTG8_9ACTN|nr:hypothetical protein FEAC_26930 [Ferrimicrobium acidiphilum DSM 19497]
MRCVGRSLLGAAHSEVELSAGSGVAPESATHKIMSPSVLLQTSLLVRATYALNWEGVYASQRPPKTGGAGPHL